MEGPAGRGALPAIKTSQGRGPCRDARSPAFFRTACARAHAADVRRCRCPIGALWASDGRALRVSGGGRVLHALAGAIRPSSLPFMARECRGCRLWQAHVDSATHAARVALHSNRFYLRLCIHG